MGRKTSNSSDMSSAFKLLFSLLVIYGLMSYFVYSLIHMKFVKPLGFDAPVHRFSEARAIQHIKVLSHDIPGRQVPSFFVFTIISINE